MPLADNGAVVRRWIEEHVTKGNQNVVEEVIAANCVWHNNPPSMRNGREGATQQVAGFRAAFPDLHVTVEDTIVDGDKVVTHWRIQGTHAGPLMGIPATGKQATWTSIHINRVTEGQIAEDWHASDLLGALRQLGIDPIKR